MSESSEFHVPSSTNELVQRTRWIAGVVLNYADEEKLSDEDLLRQLAINARKCADQIESQSRALRRERANTAELQSELDGLRAAYNA